MRIIPVALMLCFVAAAATAERPSQLEVVLDRHRAAVFEDPSKAVIDAVQVDLLIEEPAFTVTATYRANRDGRMRIDVYDGETRVFSEGLSENGGWQWYGDEDDAVAISPAGQAALERGVVANVYALHDRPALGYSLSYEGMEKQDGKRYWKIRSVAPDGFEELFYLDTDSALIAKKREVSALHPDMDARVQPSITRFSDYRLEGGRLWSFRMEKRREVDGALLQSTTVSNLRVNGGIDGEHIPLVLN